MVLEAGKYNTDKSQDFLDTYESLFSGIKDKEISLLELGVFGGGSLELWNEYFKNARIVGVDIERVDVIKSDKVRFYQGDQKDIQFLEKVSTENAPAGFDIIIDDASHFGLETFTSFIYLFKNHLKSKGIYIIEDWSTGYWPHYPDGRNIHIDQHHLSYHLHNKTNYNFVKKGFFQNRRRFRSHDYGMVGFIKQLIDEVGIQDATHQTYSNQLEKNIVPLIKKLIIKVGQVVIIKS